ncbi:MAG: hypothetical protein HOD60_08470 [Candidatus Nitrosopelagicus sp.]|jgi:tetratricopeptide (TPR) repeat protein|nr:hypothetical protein [Candidatus Nitrosopelagicus sp.]
MGNWENFAKSLKNIDILGKSDDILKELVYHGDLDKAKLSLLKELDKKPKSAGLLFAMGYLLFRKEEYYSALEYYDKYLDIKHHDSVIYNKAEILIEFLDDAEEGLKTIKLFRGTNELEQQIQELKAIALLNLKKFNECEKICIEIIEKYPSALDCIRTYADCCYEQENFQKSFDLNEKIIELDFTDIDAQNNKVDLLIKLGKYDDALKICNDMISQNSADEQALANKGEIFIKKSQFEDAIILLQNSVSIDSTYDEAWILLAKAQAHQNLIDDALDSLLVAMSLEPELIDSLKDDTFDNIRNHKRFQRLISKYSDI